MVIRHRNRIQQMIIGDKVVLIHQSSRNSKAVWKFYSTYIKNTSISLQYMPASFHHGNGASLVTLRAVVLIKTIIVQMHLQF